MKYHNITKDDMLNGDGLRVVLWVSGCIHGCKGCHNQVTWDVNDGIEFDDNAKNEIFTELSKNYISGITLSGGDPLHPQNRDEIGVLIHEIKDKFPNKTIWLYTGYLWEDICDLEFIGLVDIIIDGPFKIEQKDILLHWCGSSNQQIIDVAKTLADGHKVIYE